MPCRFASSGTVATSRSASRAILALNAASNFLRDLVISVLHRLRQSRTLHTLTFGPISGVHFKVRGPHQGACRELPRLGCTGGTAAHRAAGGTRTGPHPAPPLAGHRARREVCRRLMTTPGVGPVVALTYRTIVDVPARFRKSKAVRATFGPTCL